MVLLLFISCVNRLFDDWNSSFCLVEQRILGEDGSFGEKRQPNERVVGFFLGFLQFLFRAFLIWKSKGCFGNLQRLGHV